MQLPLEEQTEDFARRKMQLYLGPFYWHHLVVASIAETINEQIKSQGRGKKM